ncbi:MAG: hypothetical protein LBH07_05055, partial [Treponema sp.]|nr:hypothetical protein [Treponema sp.]
MVKFSFGKYFFKKKIIIKDEDQVTLPVIFGIKPWFYLAVIYAAAFLAVLFLVLIYPGISRPGSIGVFNSEPFGAAVRVNDITMGYTPCS